MLRTIVFLALLLFLVFPAPAVIRIVDNSPSAATGSYATLQAAHEAATDGDTLYVIGTGVSYGDLTSAKSLKWFGPGYFLQYNQDQQANLGSARCGAVSFNAGSSGTSFTSMQIETSVAINAGNILLRRCYIVNPNQEFLIAVGATNVIIEQCYIVHQSSAYTRHAIYLNDSGHNVTIRNNYIFTTANIDAASTSGPVEFTNNTIQVSMLSLFNAQIVNNIMRQGNFTANNSGYFYNAGHSTQFGSANGNLSNINMTTVFLGGQSPDGAYQLSVYSPVRGAGQGGTDCGMYGGQYPYVLSGVPNLPTITYFSAPTSGSTVNGLPVTFRARGRN